MLSGFGFQKKQGFEIALIAFCTLATKEATEHIPHLFFGQFRQKRQKL